MRNTLACLAAIASLSIIACNSSEGPAYDPSIVVPHKDSVTGQATASPVSDSAKLNQPAVTDPGATAQPVTAGMNPAHGQPGHRCDIPVGAPLNSPPTNTKASTPAPAQTITPSVAPTAPGMNPPHGQPGHRCDIAVGAPLNSAPAKPAGQEQVKPAQPAVTPVKSATGENKQEAAPSANPAETEKKP